MTLSIAWSTAGSLISIPQSDLTQPGASTTFFTYDTDGQFWAEVKAAEASETGIVFSDIVSRNAPYTIAGVTYAPKVEVLNPTQVEFETDHYTVQLSGSNNNIFDRENGISVKNEVSIVPTNSAGLQLVQTDVSGLTPSESADLAMLRKAFLNAQHLLEGSTANFMIWDDGADPNVDPPLWTQDVTDKDGNPIVLPIGSPAQRSEVST
jgi:hypothetical protein